MEGAFNVVDIFCGAGGLTYGFKQAGFNTILGIDADPVAIETFKINNGESAALCMDIRKVTKEQINAILNNKKVDVVIGGPPCQGFSMAGKRNQTDPRNSLFREFLRMVSYIKPKIFVIENVPGLISMQTQEKRRVIDIIETEAKSLGYHISYKVLNSADFGVPQKRRRIFIVGSIDQKLEINPKIKKQNAPVKKVLSPREEVPEKYFYSKKMIRGFLRREKINSSLGRGFRWQFLDPEKPSYTIPARYWKDGSNALIKYSDKAIRMLTPRECALIQSFPRGYNFIGSEKNVYTQIGNAVPPQLAKAVAKEIKSILWES